MRKSPDAPPRAPSPKRLSATRAACESRAIGFPLRSSAGVYWPPSITCFAVNPGLIPRQDAASIDDKSFGKSALAPPRLRRLRNRIQLQPVGAVLVFRRGVPSADAHGRQRLSLPGLPAQTRRTARRRRCDVTGKWNVSAVLLDMDGTLLDTERVYFDSLVAALKTHGYTDDTDDAVPGDGRPSRSGLRGHAARALRRKLSACRRSTGPSSRNRDEILGAGLPLKSGAVELLDALQAAECPMAIVTSSSRRTAERASAACRNSPRASKPS